MKKYLSLVITTGIIAAITGCQSGDMQMKTKSGLASNNSDNSSLCADGAVCGMGVRGSATFVGSNSDDSNLGSDEQAANQYYFPFDNSTLSSAAKHEVRKHARYLLQNPHVKVRVEGHTDERGSREYNIALGERRAKSVSNLLASEGVAKDQVDVVSYGEEKPSVRGNNENAYQWNRRARLVYEVG